MLGMRGEGFKEYNFDNSRMSFHKTIQVRSSQLSLV